MTFERMMECAFKAGDVVKANYTFKKDKNEDLPFNENETLEIINIGKDPNWAHAKNAVGETGLIPLNYVQRKTDVLEDLKDHCWYHGRISRAESESLLSGSPVGSFLIRESDLYSGGLTLCVVGPSCTVGSVDVTEHQNSTMAPSDSATNVQHYRIVRRPFKSAHPIQHSDYPTPSICSKIHYTLDETDWFPSLLELVQFYSQPKRGLVCALLHPIPDMQRKRLNKLQKSGYLIFRKEIQLGDRIGRGEFGEVLKATYHGRQVAVKIYKKTASKLAITYEASLMTKINHPNLVSFIGLVYEPDDAVYLVTEYLSNGSLLTYLHSRTRDEITELTKLKFSTDVCRGLVYLEERDFIHRDIAARNVLLSGKMPNLIAKVADFGMARDLHDLSSFSGVLSHQPLSNKLNTTPTLVISSNSPTSDHSVDKYSKTNHHHHHHHETHCQSNEPVDDNDDDDNLTSPPSLNPMVLHDNAAIPLKWTAPEAVRDRLFTTKSDVWSYGILLWEIYSYGRIPYPRMMANQVLRHIESGYRMKSPEDCPSTIYSLMLRTWHSEPSNRPSFVEILKELIQLRNNNNNNNNNNNKSLSPSIPSIVASTTHIHPMSIMNNINKSFPIDCDNSTPWDLHRNNPIKTVTNNTHNNNNNDNNNNLTTYNKQSDSHENRSIMKKNQSTDLTLTRHKSIQRPKTLADLITEPLYNNNNSNNNNELNGPFYSRQHKSPNRTISTMSRSFISTLKTTSNHKPATCCTTPNESCHKFTK
ncbi:unnamed protein product [Schistosoma turkestanicum]|nr:unnamed protein product [Schistosoma turkestanicum]